MSQKFKYDIVRIGKNIRFLRKNKNLTIDELASAVGIAPSYMGLVERGQRRVSVDKLLKICSFFDITLNIMITVDFGGENSFPETSAAENNKVPEMDIEALRSQLEELINAASAQELTFMLNLISDMKAYSHLFADVGNKETDSIPKRGARKNKPGTARDYNERN